MYRMKFGITDSHHSSDTHEPEHSTIEDCVMILFWADIDMVHLVHQQPAGDSTQSLEAFVDYYLFLFRVILSHVLTHGTGTEPNSDIGVELISEVVLVIRLKQFLKGSVRTVQEDVNVPWH